MSRSLSLGHVVESCAAVQPRSRGTSGVILNALVCVVLWVLCEELKRLYEQR